VQSLSGRVARDALSDVLATVRFRSALLCRSEMTAPWGFAVTGRDFATFHLVLEGGGFVDVAGRRVRIDAGDLVILPRGNDHAVRDAPDSRVTRLEELISHGRSDARGTLHTGGGGPRTVIVCGAFHFEEPTTHPLLLGLPSVIHLRTRTASQWVRTAVKFLKQESDGERPGADLVVTRLADVLFIEALRAHLASPEGRRSGLAAALRDPRVGKALGLIHRQLRATWSVARLANEVGMSRTAFSLRFRELMGESPIRYATRCRIDHAAGLLRASDESLSEVATRVGYGSEIGFGRAFKRFVGTSPAVWRRRARNGIDGPRSSR
jgi:AraC-like DNA-binding protein